jgi:hypothetical protein
MPGTRILTAISSNPIVAPLFNRGVDVTAFHRTALRGFLHHAAEGALAFALVALSPTGPAAAQSGEVVITFAYTLVEDQLSPHSGQVRSQWTRTYRLSGKNLIGQTIAMNGQALETTNTALGHSGSGVSAVNGLAYSVESHVVGGAITLLEEAPSFRTRTVVRTNGRSSCSATREYLLKPGHKYFEVATPGQHIPESDTNMHIENATCTISA